jgi:glycosyltransferase involved in cell wall biosynthesis
MIDVSVVVPVYRNAETLQELYDRVHSTMQNTGLSYELILVNDACADGSARVVDDLARSHSAVRAVHLSKNGGQHRALLAGLRIARGRWAVFMDGDLQDPPEAIPSLIDEGERGNPVVFAGRRGNYESTSRMMSGKLYRGILHLASGLPRDAGAFVAVDREAIDRILSLRGPSPFIPTMIWCTGLPLRSIPVERSVRPRGKSAYSSSGRARAAAHAFAWIIWKHAHRAFQRNSSASTPQPSTR